MKKISKQDLDYIKQQLGREPRGILEISVRDSQEQPLVVKTNPVIETEIFPTLYYLVNNDMINKVAKLESSGLLAQLQQKVDTDKTYQDLFIQSQKSYRQERNKLVNVNKLSESQKAALNTGIGGVKNLTRVKCLHCHLAHYLAIGSNPAGKKVYLAISHDQVSLRGGAKEGSQTARSVSEHGVGYRSDRTPNSKRMIKAAIDIGTNSTRLLVAEVKNGQVKNLHREARVTRLGQGVDKNKLLLSEAINRTIDVLKEYKQIAEQLGAEEIVAGATSAARDAKNIDEFIDQTKMQTDLNVKVLSAKQEAQYSFKGATFAFDFSPLASRLTPLVLDIGGGSTELTLGNPKTEEIIFSCSKDVGSVRLTELFINNDPPLEEELKKAKDFIIRSYSSAIEEIKNKKLNYQLVGTAGTITTIAAINLGLERYDSDKVNQSTLTRNDVENIYYSLKKQTVSESRKIVVMQEGRADVIVAGALILLTLLEMFELDTLIVSESDILDGLLLSSI